jgi:hypothetical protein
VVKKQEFIILIRQSYQRAMIKEPREIRFSQNLQIMVKAAWVGSLA